MIMNYEEMSDFEINKLAAEKLGFIVNDTQKDNGVGDITVQSKVVGGSQFIPMNYCNNPLDAWPIMLENKIATEWHYADVWRAQCDNQHKPGSYKVFTSYCYNPLRAAMICFLKMKDAECKS